MFAINTNSYNYSNFHPHSYVCFDMVAQQFLVYIEAYFKPKQDINKEPMSENINTTGFGNFLEEILKKFPKPVFVCLFQSLSVKPRQYWSRSVSSSIIEISLKYQESKMPRKHNKSKACMTSQQHNLFTEYFNPVNFEHT